VASGGVERVRGLVFASHYETDGISASAIQPERDSYENTTLHGVLDVDLGERISARLVARRHDNEVETDRQDFDFPDTPTQGLVVDSNDHTESTQFYGLAELRAALLDDRWHHRVAYGYTQAEADNYEAGRFGSSTRGERRRISYDTTFRFGADEFRHALTGAVHHEDLDFDQRFVSFPGATQSQSDDQTSYVVEYALSWRSNASATLSGRHDDNDRFDDATTWRATGSWLFESTSTRVHASYGEGITNPTFTELFGFFPDSYIGNPDLKPEESQGWDVGVEQAMFAGRALLDVTWFDTTLDDEIVTVFLPTFDTTSENQTGESERRGLEVALDARFDERWSLRAAYTWLDATDPNGEEEVRRPRHTGSVNGNFATGRWNVNLGALYNGAQEDSEFVNATPATRVGLDGYTLVNLAISFDVTDNVQLFARGENLLDEDYAEIFSVRSPGIAGYLGARVRL
jgi:vitamin B12 transporter